MAGMFNGKTLNVLTLVLLCASTRIELYNEEQSGLFLEEEKVKCSSYLEEKMAAQRACDTKILHQVESPDVKELDYFFTENECTEEERIKIKVELDLNAVELVYKLNFRLISKRDSLRIAKVEDFCHLIETYKKLRFKKSGKTKTDREVAGIVNNDLQIEKVHKYQQKCDKMMICVNEQIELYNNVIFAINIICLLQDRTVLNALKQAIVFREGRLQLSPERLISFAPDFFVKTPNLSLNKRIAEVLKGCSIIKSALYLITIKKNKELCDTTDFIIQHPLVSQSVIDSCQAVEIKANNAAPAEIDFIEQANTMLSAENKIKMLKITIPDEITIEFLEAVCCLMALNRQVRKIRIVCNVLNRSNEEDYKNAKTVDAIISAAKMNLLYVQEIVIMGQRSLALTTVEMLGNFNLKKLGLLGVDAYFDYIYLYDIFSIDCNLKESIRVFLGNYGAYLLLNEMLPENRIRQAELLPAMQLECKEIFIETIKHCRAMSLYFEQGSIVPTKTKHTSHIDLRLLSFGENVKLLDPSAAVTDVKDALVANGSIVVHFNLGEIYKDLLVLPEQSNSAKGLGITINSLNAESISAVISNVSSVIDSIRYLVVDCCLDTDDSDFDSMLNEFVYLLVIELASLTVVEQKMEKKIIIRFKNEVSTEILEKIAADFNIFSTKIEKKLPACVFDQVYFENANKT
ncbi:hypothetical protein ENBRE01_1700 [Enteropsectra breve]|nr:hypothetical protein ENBRE01_1519 [Enteropsectra breve]KAI5150772.1 hypothetical protein ENBRE01_1700 [Enteropsectra breve]